MVVVQDVGLLTAAPHAVEEGAEAVRGGGGSTAASVAACAERHKKEESWRRRKARSKMPVDSTGFSYDGSNHFQDKAMSFNCLSRMMKKLVRRVNWRKRKRAARHGGVPEQWSVHKIKPHSLRHGAAMNYRRMGVEASTAAFMLRLTLEMYMRVYGNHAVADDPNNVSGGVVGCAGASAASLAQQATDSGSAASAARVTCLMEDLGVTTLRALALAPQAAVESVIQRSHMSRAAGLRAVCELARAEFPAEAMEATLAAARTAAENEAVAINAIADCLEDAELAGTVGCDGDDSSDSADESEVGCDDGANGHRALTGRGSDR